MMNLSQYDAVFLDMNGTFMFDQDRFGPTVNYYPTYLELGGSSLDQSTVNSTINNLSDVMEALDRNAARQEDYPTVDQTMSDILAAAGIPASEAAVLEAVVSAHELGRVSDEYVRALQVLAKTNRLALVANIWSKKEPWIYHLTDRGVLDLFEVTVFSSEHGCIKPGRRIYQIALDAMGVDPSKVLFVGDDPRYDVEGPKRFGMTTALINSEEAAARVRSDYRITSLLELLPSSEVSQ